MSAALGSRFEGLREDVENAIDLRRGIVEMRAEAEPEAVITRPTVGGRDGGFFEGEVELGGILAWVARGQDARTK